MGRKKREGEREREGERGRERGRRQAWSESATGCEDSGHYQAEKKGEVVVRGER